MANSLCYATRNWHSSVKQIYVNKNKSNHWKDIKTLKINTLLFIFEPKYFIVYLSFQIFVLYGNVCLLINGDTLIHNFQSVSDVLWYQITKPGHTWPPLTITLLCSPYNPSAGNSVAPWALLMSFKDRYTSSREYRCYPQRRYLHSTFEASNSEPQWLETTSLRCRYYSSSLLHSGL